MIKIQMMLTTTTATWPQVISNKSQQNTIQTIRFPKILNIYWIYLHDLLNAHLLNRVGVNAQKLTKMHFFVIYKKHCHCFAYSLFFHNSER